MRRRVLLVLLVGLAGCTPAHIAKQLVTANPNPTASGPSTGQGAQRPIVWFAPRPPPRGFADFMDLFTTAAAWPRAASHVGVFELDGGWVTHDATDEELRTVVSSLNGRGMALAVETGRLFPAPSCGHVKSFAVPSDGLSITRRLAAAGATADLFRYVALDEPFAFGHILTGRSACRWPVPKLAGQVATYIRDVRRVFPELQIGDAEPLWAGVDPKELEAWIATFRDVTGSELAFFNLDVDFSRLDWPQAAKELEGFCRSRDIPFGIVYTGEGDSDQAFDRTAEDRFVAYEAKAGGHPDQVVFQSGVDRPTRALPELEPGTFTYLVDRYVRARTRIDMAVEASVHAGSFRAAGTLTEGSGSPVSGATVEVSLTPLDGQGGLATYTLTGTVPGSATRADVGLRVNTQCGCSGTADITLYGAMYTENSETANRVPNGVFGARLDGWRTYLDGTARLERNDRGSGWMLNVTASPRQSTIVKSADFAVSPNGTYSLRFEARVSPGSVGSGYFSLVFLGPNGEVALERIPFAPESFELGTGPTDASGGFHVTFHPPGAGNFLVEVWFRGDQRLWPAYQSARLSVSR